jgi:cobalt-zinc-cadmium efflux system membrane fusion protein
MNIKFRNISMICLLTVAVLWGTAGCTSSSPERREEHQEKQDQGHGEEGHEHGEEGHEHGQEGHEHGQEGHEHGEEAGVIHVDTSMQKRAGIQTADVRHDQLYTTISAPARIVPTQQGIAHVGPLIAGRIVRLYVTEGSTVKAGAVLAELEAFGIAELKSDYLRAMAETEQTEAALRRSETLDQEKIGAKRTVEEARAAYRKAVAEQQSLKARLQVLGFNPTNIRHDDNISARVQLHAPLGGIISRSTAALGEFVQPENDIFQIVNTSTVWADAQLQPEQAAILQTGQKATIGGTEKKQRTGTIIFISPTVDPSSRTVTVRLSLENNDNLFRPESFTTVRFNSTVTDSGLTVPRPALEFDNGMYYVYRQSAINSFERVQVQVGAMNEQRATIRTGLEAGDRIAVDGVFYLKSMRNQGELAEHHH